MKRKVFYSAVFLFFFLIISGKVDARSTISQLRSKYPSGSIYTDGPYSYSGVTYDDNGTQLVFNHTDKECSGFAATMYRQYFGVDREWSTKITDKSGIPNISAGDIVRNNNHSVFVLSRSGNYVTVAEANYGNTYNMIHWDRSININEFYTNFEYIYKAYFPFDNPNSAPAVEVPTNITASYNGSTNRLILTWKQVKKASGYKIRIFRKSDVENNNWNSPVFEKIDDSNSSGQRFYDFNINGEFYVFVVAILDEYYATNGGTPAEFTRIEANSVTIQNKPTGDVYIGENFQLKSLITPTNANAGNKVTWSSSNTDVASITSSSGYVNPKSEGTVTITVKTSNNKTDKCTFNVKQRVDVESILLDKSDIGLIVGESYKLNPTINPTNATDKTINWSSSDNSIVEVDQQGNINGIKSGTATITAKTNNNKTATCKVVVRNAGVAAEFTKDIIIARFSSLNLLDYIKTSDDSEVDTSVLTLRVKSGKENTYSINGTTLKFNDTVSSYDNELYEVELEYLNSKDTMKIRKTPKTITGFSLSFRNDSSINSLNIGDSFTTYVSTPYYGDEDCYVYAGYLELKVLYNPEHFEVTSLSSDLENAEISDDRNGTVRVKVDYNGDIRNIANLNMMNIGFKTIVNSTISDYMRFGEILYRQFGPDNEIKNLTNSSKNQYSIYKVNTIESVTITNKIETLNVGDTHNLVTEYLPSNAVGDKTITWTSSDNTIVSVDLDGKLKALKEGKVTITAKIGDISDSFELNITNPSIDITGITIKQYSETVEVGKGGTVVAEITPSNTTMSKKVTFTVNSSSLASLSTAGESACSFTAKVPGIIKITATTVNGKTASCMINIVPRNIPVNDITLDQTNIDINVGESKTINATISPVNASDKVITWRSGNDKIATVDNGTVTGIKVGTTEITATTSNGLSKTVNVIVKNNEITKAPSVEYRTHVQDYGWQKYVSDGAMSGTSGKSKRLEGINIKINNSDYSGGIEYRTHVENIGWQNYVSNGKMSGTEGRSLRLEAIQIRLTGEIANYYDVYYRVHCQNIGWMGWAKNDEKSGSAGYGFRLEGIEVVLVKKGENPPQRSNTNYNKPYKYTLVAYKTHIQDYGWQDYVIDNEVSGTSGESKRLEGIKIFLTNPDYTGGIEYRTHVQDYGWQNYVSNNEMSGTSGESKRLEAIQIRLTGEMANHYDIYYRVHCQNIGWMGWAKNDEQAGTAGYSYRLEAIQIVLVEKEGNAPKSTSKPFLMKA